VGFPDRRRYGTGLVAVADDARRTNRLIDVSAVKEHAEGILIEGKIMGSMPMKAAPRPEELRSAFKFVTWSIARREIGMLIRGRGPAYRTDGHFPRAGPMEHS
jgi:hypothetical protein